MHHIQLPLPVRRQTRRRAHIAPPTQIEPAHRRRQYLLYAEGDIALPTQIEPPHRRRRYLLCVEGDAIHLRPLRFEGVGGVMNTRPEADELL